MRPAFLPALLVSVLSVGLVASAAAAPAPAPEAKAKDTSPTPAPLELGSSAVSQDVKMLGVDGKQITLADAKGDKGLLVIFTCNHCPYVKAWDDRIAALGNSAKAKGFGVIAINSNDPERVPQDGLTEMQARAKEKGLTYPYVVDSTSGVARAFGASRTPEVFLFDAAGKLAYHGAVDDNGEDASAVDQHYLADAVQSLLDGKELDILETKAIGCSIKFRT